MGAPAWTLGPLQAPSPAAASLGTSLGTSPQSHPFPVTPPSAHWVQDLLQLPKLSIPQGWSSPTLGTLVWFRKVFR